MKAWLFSVETKVLTAFFRCTLQNYVKFLFSPNKWAKKSQTIFRVAGNLYNKGWDKLSFTRGTIEGGGQKNLPGSSELPGRLTVCEVVRTAISG